jgi:hypothetical protein
MTKICPKKLTRNKLSSVLLGPNLAKFRLENYDFDLDKGCLMEKMTQIRQISKKKFQIFNEKFQYVARNIESFFFLNFISST